MSVWEEIYQAIANRIEEEDKAFELADLRFGGARKWLVGHAFTDKGGSELAYPFGSPTFFI